MTENHENTSSNGAQLKFYNKEDHMWYKQDYMGTEGLSEYAASMLLSGSNVPYVKYMPCKFLIEKRNVIGCKSENFLKQGEQLISTHKLIKIHYGIDIEKLIVPMSIEDKIQTYVDKVVSVTGYEDFGSYLTKILQLDAVTKNDDRHFNNISFILDKEGNYRPAPIFDNGGAFLSDQYTYGENLQYDEVLMQMDKVTAKPFSRDFDEQMDVCEKLYPAKLILNKKPHIDVDMLSKFYALPEVEKIQIILNQSIGKYQYLFQETKELTEEKHELGRDET